MLFSFRCTQQILFPRNLLLKPALSLTAEVRIQARKQRQQQVRTTGLWTVGNGFCYRAVSSRSGTLSNGMKTVASSHINNHDTTGRGATLLRACAAREGGGTVLVTGRLRVRTQEGTPP
ncbi:hypothetical protein BaRGS_00029438 [Batillaria attramentaria]|uniref:Uncharacterized protein n=1 Tax=Batillaria attramentaria TaxID=370345 RepID=A0ABD0JW91_9CAEN